MTAPYRLPLEFDGPAIGRLVDRSRPLSFTFDGTRYSAFAGDTLASGLLANGVRVVARSFKYHRPRGLFSAGIEEPNALVTIGEGGRRTPNLRAPMVELHDGLVATSQNRWPSLAFDIGAANGLLSRVIPAGFYYKTFMWPASAWPFYERLIRRAAGLGRAADAADPDRYEQIHATCDVLVAGSGIAGLAAATAAADAGFRVIVADQSRRLGGQSDLFDGTIDGQPALDWIRNKVANLAARDNVHLLARTTVAGRYDHNYVLMAERLTDHVPQSAGPGGAPRERLWKVRAREIVVATGAVERSLAFANNDRPGVMLSSAVRAYAVRHGVAPGSTGVVFTNTDDGYRTALTLKAAGIEVPWIVDARGTPEGPLVEAAREQGIEIAAGHVVANVETALGGKEIRSVQFAARRETGRIGTMERVDCDFVSVSGGWNPQAHLLAHCGGRLEWDEAIQSLRPSKAEGGIRAAGAANGVLTLEGGLKEGYAAGEAAVRAIRSGRRRAARKHREAVEEVPDRPVEPMWFAPSYGSLGEGAKHFLDLQHDVTVADVELAVREGYANPEHLKRYTTLGMAPDQGKTGNVGAIAIHAEAAGVPIEAIAPTTFRPPYSPVTFGAIAGMQAKDLFQPVRLTPVWHWNRLNGADFEPVGQWRRPYCYGAGEMSRTDAVAAEVNAVRTGIGILDASTLGKIEVRGPDAACFLDRIYAGSMSTLKQGRCRYGLMLNDEGFLFDDGVVARFAEDHFLLHTTSGGADHAAGWLELWLQTEWPDLKVFVTPVTEQWSQFAVSGPAARDLVMDLGGDIVFTREALPHLGHATGTLAGFPVRVFRISYTGELTFEIACPSSLGSALWDALLAAGERYGIVPFGTEALHVLRAEKGYIAIGDETDGTVTPFDLGLSWAVAGKKPDFIGKRGLERSALVRTDRRQLVGLLATDGARVLPDGAYLIDAADRDAPPPHRPIGHVTSSYMSPTLGRSIALALVERGRERLGETVRCPLEREAVEAEIVDPVFYDKAGARLNA